MKTLLQLLLLIGIVVESNAQRYEFPPNFLPYMTTRIVGTKDSVIDGNDQRITVTGTGFFYIFDINGKEFKAIVTNRHVVENMVNGKLTLKIADSAHKLGDRVKSDTLYIRDFGKQWIFHPTEDLAILPFDPLVARFKKKHPEGIPMMAFANQNIPSVKDSLQVSSIEKVLMIGYPRGKWDSTNNFPLVRQGLTATSFFQDYNGSPHFLVDIPVFEGSSGSPVILYSYDPYWSTSGVLQNDFRFYLLGIAVTSIKYEEEGKVKSPMFIQLESDSTRGNISVSTAIPLSIATAIRADKLNDFIPVIQAKFLK